MVLNRLVLYRFIEIQLSGRKKETLIDRRYDAGSN
jgi:hypothetical protein